VLNVYQILLNLVDSMISLSLNYLFIFPSIALYYLLACTVIDVSNMWQCVFGGSKACLFVMVSPDASNLQETVSTLQFGSNAQQVQLGQAKKNVIKGQPHSNDGY